MGQTGGQPKTVNDTVTWSRCNGTGWQWWDAASWQHGSCSVCSVRRMGAGKWTFMRVCLVLICIGSFLRNQN